MPDSVRRKHGHHEKREALEEIQALADEYDLPAITNFVKSCEELFVVLKDHPDGRTIFFRLMKVGQALMMQGGAGVFGMPGV